MEKELKEEIEKEMNDAVEETIKEIEEDIKNDKELQEETDDIFSTEDIEERIKKFNKYHPNDDRFKGEIVYEK